MDDITAIIVAKDYPPHIFETITSVSSLCSKVIVLDIGIDETLKTKLINTSQVSLVSIQESVPYVELIRQKSLGYAKTDYVLIMDPDETLPSTLVEELKRNYKNYDYIKIPRKNIIFGSWIKHARWWPDYQIRLFKRDNVKWSEKLHAQPEFSGNGLSLEPNEQFAITHHNYNNLDEYFQKALRYAKADVEKNTGDLPQHLDQSISEFISRFYADKGYKDNMHGFVLAFLQMIYPMLVYFYKWEKNNYQQIEKESDLIKIAHGFFSKGYIESNHWLSKTDGLTTTQKLKHKSLNKILKLLK